MATSRRAVPKRLLMSRPPEVRGTGFSPCHARFFNFAMRVLVTFAVEAEFAPWRKLRDLESLAINDVPVFRARVGSAAVDFALTGMGVENAFRAANTLLGEPYQVCVTCGFAGALRENHFVGRILV